MHGRHVNPEKLRELIDELRASRGWTMQQFIAHAGLSPSLVYYALAGKRQLSVVTAAKMAKALDRSTAEFTDPDQEVDAP
jgi:transcriptional regulator with XRE-family HTH domain